MFKLIFFESHTSHERQFLGGKGAALFKLKKKGPYPIPQTFILSSEGIQKWLESFNHYQDFKLQWAENKLTSSHAFYQELQTHPFDGSLKSILNLLNEQFSDGVIVRSSMSVEDHEDFSLAGHFESVLVPKAQIHEIENAIRKVIASGYTPQNIITLNSYGIHPDEFLAAVVFQPILKAKFSGVLFTINPHVPWEKKALIEWVKGHLSGLVHGSTDGIITHEDEVKDLPELEKEIFTELLQLARRAEKVFDKPLDIEWIFDGHDLWIVQARPITQDDVLLSFRTRGKRRWSRELTLERFPGKMTPMGWSSLKTAFQSNLNVLNSRMGILVKKPEDIAVMFRHVIYSDPAFFSFPSGVALKASFFLNPFQPYLWIMLKAFLSFFFKKIMGKMSAIEKSIFKMNLTKSLLAKLINEIQDGWRDHVSQSMSKASNYDLAIRKKNNLDPDELERELNAMNAISMSFLENDLPIYIIKETFFKILEDLWSKAQLSRESFFELFKGVEGNVTLLMGEDIAKLAQVFKVDPQGILFLTSLKNKCKADESVLSEKSQLAWENFLTHYGHHTTSWDVAVETWGEDPSLIASLLLRQLESNQPMEKKLSSRTNNYEKELEQFKNYYGEHWNAIHSIINLVKNFMLIDEEQHFLSGRLIPPSRQLMLKMGESLVQRAQIQEREDVFFLSLEEVMSYLKKSPFNLKLFIERRKKDFTECDLKLAPYELGLTDSDQKELNEAGIKGLAVSPGIIEAKAYWISESTDWSNLPANFIMLIDSPNPVFIPLYRSIKGIISMSGGYLSHGFVCAREYHLPAVSQIKNLPSLIKNGDMVRLNGTTGMIELVVPV